MKTYKIVFSVVIAAMVVSCDLLETKVDYSNTESMMQTKNGTIIGYGYRAYQYMENGFTELDGNLMSPITDESQFVTTTSAAQRFVEGSWGPYYNPMAKFAGYYDGLDKIHRFLEESVEYKEILARNRDTISPIQRDNYLLDIEDVERLRAESHILKAYFYLELMKRFGGVPIIDRYYENPNDANLPRGTVDEVVELIVREIDGHKDDLVVNWAAIARNELSGRITKGVALAIKSRALLYAASPLFNPENDLKKWEDAAWAAFDLINMNQYSLHPSYSKLFVGDETNTSSETIWARRLGATNDFERSNYPIATLGGQSGVCPSHNLVMEYEHKGVETSDIYENLDPRFYATIVYNGCDWNGRTIEMFAEGLDDPAKQNTSPTGYYLKKFMNENLNLTNDAKAIRSWIIFRYAEILLNFAEAMNEAFGPDNANGMGMTAREAVNMVRSRVDVMMPEVDIPVGDQAGMRKAIKHERMIELAFEGHRYWDLKRWGDAEIVLNEPIKGVVVSKIGEDEFSYTVQDIADRYFDAPKMNLFPIPEAQIVQSGGVLEQNQGW